MSLYEQYLKEKQGGIKPKSLYDQYKQEQFLATPQGQKIQQYQAEAEQAGQRAQEMGSPWGLVKGTFSPSNLIQAAGQVGKGILGGIKGIGSYLGQAVKHPVQTGAGAFEEAIFKPTIGVTRLAGAKGLAQKEEAGLKEYEEQFTPNKKAREVGEFLGWMIPYSTAEKAIKGVSLIKKAGKLAPVIADLGAWLSTDQLLYDPKTDGSRAKQALEDLAAFGVLKGAGKLFGLAKGRFAVRVADEAVKPVEEAMKRGKKVPLEVAEEAVNKVKRIIKTGTGKEPKQVVKEEIVPKLAPDLEKPVPKEKIPPKAEKPAEPKIPKELARKTLDEIPEEKLKGITVDYKGEKYKVVRQTGIYGDKVLIEGEYGKQLSIPKKQLRIVKPTEPVLDTLNPTGSLLVDYKPQERATMKLGENITTLDKTMGKSPNTEITIYRGAPKIQKEIVPGDFITTNYELAKSYTGEGNILSKKVKLKDILDDKENPLGEEYIYRPLKGLKQPKPVEKAKRIKPAIETKIKIIDTGKTAEEQARILMELETAEKGERFHWEDYDGTPHTIGKHSSFPKWIPEKLRRKKLVDAVLEHIYNDTLPKKVGEIRLYNVVAERLGLIKASKDVGEELNPKDIFKEDYEEIRTISGTQKEKVAENIKRAEREARTEKLPEFPNKEKSIELQATLIPGMKEFTEKDIVPQVKGIRNFAGKLVETLKNTFTPEANSIRAQKVDALLASKIMGLERTRQVLWKIAENQKNWWDKISDETRYDYLDLVQKGKATKENLLKLANGDKKVAKTLWGMIKQDRIAYDDVYKRETELGIRMHYQENYLPQIWKDVKKAKAFFAKYAKSLGKDRFTKKKVIPLISVGRKAGLELKTSNPSELRLMRQFDGERAIMRQQFINKLVDEGIAEKYTKDTVVGDRSLIDAPDGHRYAVENDVMPLLNNALFSPSLWSSKSIGGDIFRGVSRAKNLVVPIKLSLSLFHPLHILGIDQSSRAAIAWENIIKGGLNWKEGTKELIKANTSFTQKEAIKQGIKINQAWDKPTKELTDYEATAIKHIVEGGGTPKMSDVWRIKAIDGFKKAVREGNYPGATIRGIPALVESYQKPMFEVWIPATKTMSYLRDVELLLKRKPELVNNEALRKIELRKIWKSTDNRYGQLVYKTLFWQPFIKNIGIGSSLSMGWTLGFIREMGGGILDTGDLMIALAKKAKGEKIPLKDYITRRMLFSADYTIRAMIVGGLITYAMTGKKPQKLLDFFFPKSGEGEHRLNTPWYTREFFSLVNHWKKQGYLEGTFHYFTNKANPVIMPLVRSWQNKDYFGYEIRNENDPRLKQLEDTLKYLSEEEFLPISATSYQRAKREMPKKKALITSFVGYTPAPRYITETPIQTKIYSIYSKRFSGGVRTQSQKEKSQVKTEIRNLYLRGKNKEANQKLHEAVKKGYISRRSVKRFIEDSDLPSDIRAFRALPAEDQKGLLSKMSLKDISRYAWYVKKELKPKFSKISKNTAEFVKLYRQGRIKKPVWKRQKLVK